MEAGSTNVNPRVLFRASLGHSCYRWVCYISMPRLVYERGRNRTAGHLNCGTCEHEFEKRSEWNRESPAAAAEATAPPDNYVAAVCFSTNNSPWPVRTVESTQSTHCCFRFSFPLAFASTIVLILIERGGTGVKRDTEARRDSQFSRKLPTFMAFFSNR